MSVSAHVCVRSQSRTYKQPVAFADLIIAGSAARHGLLVLTRNLRDFSRLGVPAVDPFVELPADSQRLLDSLAR